MDWLNWLLEAEVAWYSSMGKALELPGLLVRAGQRASIRFKVDTGAAQTLVPLHLVRNLIPEQLYQARKTEIGLRNLQSKKIQGAWFDDIEIEIPMTPPFTDRGLVRAPSGLWVSEETHVGLLGMSFLEKFGLLVFNFSVEGPYTPEGPHFGLVERPQSTLSL